MNRPSSCRSYQLCWAVIDAGRSVGASNYSWGCLSQPAALVIVLEVRTVVNLTSNCQSGSFGLRTARRALHQRHWSRLQSGTTVTTAARVNSQKSRRQPRILLAGNSTVDRSIASVLSGTCHCFSHIWISGRRLTIGGCVALQLLLARPLPAASERHVSPWELHSAGVFICSGWHVRSRRGG